MRLRIRNGKDFYSGAMFTLCAVAFGGGGSRYPIGSAVEMGAGYFPIMVAIALAIVGVALVARGVCVADPVPRDPDEPRFAFRPLLLINAAVLVFALTVGWLGLVFAGLATVLIAARAGWEFRWKEATLLAVVCTAVAVALFVYGLGLPFAVWPK
jgi:hypothetical protein